MEEALGYINSAIAEIKLGIQFDRRTNHASAEVSVAPTSPDQPHMQAALDHLRNAKQNLDSATPDKGGHRKKAIEYVNAAIDEVKKGIDFAN
jgi:hypothetical protein